MSTAYNYNKMAAVILSAALQKIQPEEEEAETSKDPEPVWSETESHFLETHQDLITQLTNPQNMAATIQQMDAIDLDKDFVQMLDKWKRKQTLTITRNRYIRMALAAAVVIVVSAVLLYLFLPAKKVNLSMTMPIPDSRELASYLLFEDGRKVMLDGAAGNEAITVNGGSQMTVSGDTITYTHTGTPRYSPEQVSHSSLVVSRNTQKVLRLPGGIEIKVNAESALTFPLNPTGKTSNFSLLGEAFFDITEAAGTVFTTTIMQAVGDGTAVPQATVEVHGTEFNIRAYRTEPTQVTLLSGSLALKTTKEQVELTKGEQATIHGTGIQKRKMADPDKAIAWKSGLFRFDDDSIDVIVHELERWYNVSIQYSGKQNTGKLMLYAPRSFKLDRVLASLRELGYKFKVVELTTQPK